MIRKIWTGGFVVLTLGEVFDELTTFYNLQFDKVLKTGHIYEGNSFARPYAGTVDCIFWEFLWIVLFWVLPYIIMRFVPKAYGCLLPSYILGLFRMYYAIQNILLVTNWIH